MTNNTYQRLCALYYDVGKPTAPENELRFYLHYAQAAHGVLLEPMCGTGRFLIPFLEKGLDIAGFDASPYMLEILKQKAAQRNLTPQVYQQFVYEMESDLKKYALIFIPSGSFGLITDAQQVYESLQLFYDHLVPKGKLVFEIETPTAFTLEQNIWQSSSVRKDATVSLTLHRLPSYNPQTQIVDVLCHYQLLNNNSVAQEEQENFNVKLYNHNELDQPLHDIGFIVAKYAACTHNQPHEADPIITYECTKK
jgi:hypothetical protein